MFLANLYNYIIFSRRRNRHDDNEQAHFYFVLDRDMVKMESQIPSPAESSRRHVQSYRLPSGETQPMAGDNTYDVLVYRNKPKNTRCDTQPGQQNTYDHMMFSSNNYDVPKDERHIKRFCDNTYSHVNRQDNSSTNLNVAEPEIRNIYEDKTHNKKLRLSGGVPKITYWDNDHVYDQCQFRHSLGATNNAVAVTTLPMNGRKSLLDACDPYDERVYESLKSLNLDTTTNNSPQTQLHSNGNSNTNIYSSLTKV